MLITVDTSTLIAVIGNELSKERATELTAGHELIAPPSVHWEIGNALSGMIKRKRITQNQASLALSAYERIPLRYFEVELEESLRWVTKHRMFAYDAYLLECARKSKSALLSLDRALVNIAKSENIRVLEV